MPDSPHSGRTWLQSPTTAPSRCLRERRNDLESGNRAQFPVLTAGFLKINTLSDVNPCDGLEEGLQVETLPLGGGAVLPCNVLSVEAGITSRFWPDLP
jgi:hypothetical protein